MLQPSCLHFGKAFAVASPPWNVGLPDVAGLTTSPGNLGQDEPAYRGTACWLGCGIQSSHLPGGLEQIDFSRSPIRVD